LHLRGRLTRLPDDALCDHLDRLSADQERRLLPKTPWTVAKMTPDAQDRLMRQIVPLRTTLTKSTPRGSWDRTNRARCGRAPQKRSPLRLRCRRSRLCLA